MNSDANGPRAERREVVLNRWQALLNDLFREVKGWVEKAGWRTRTVQKPVQDGGLGRYQVPVLLMERGAVQVALNPVSPLVSGAEGAVDLYLVPAYDDIATLYFQDGAWVIYYSFAPDDAQAGAMTNSEALPLSEQTVTDVLNAITSHAT